VNTIGLRARAQDFLPALPAHLRCRLDVLHALRCPPAQFDADRLFWAEHFASLPRPLPPRGGGAPWLWYGELTLALPRWRCRAIADALRRLVTAGLVECRPMASHTHLLSMAVRLASDADEAGPDWGDDDDDAGDWGDDGELTELPPFERAT
jgi:hypothetical protein